MQPTKVSELLLHFKHFVPEEKITTLDALFRSMAEDDYSFIKSIPIKSPRTTLGLAIFAGWLGADRFYIQDNVGGLQKLLLGWATLGSWHIVDFFLTHNLCKEYNYQLIVNSIKDYAEQLGEKE